MVDKLVYCDDNRARTNFLVQEGNILVEDGVLVEAGLVENIAQTAAARSGYLSKIEKKNTTYWLYRRCKKSRNCIVTENKCSAGNRNHNKKPDF